MFKLCHMFFSSLFIIHFLQTAYAHRQNTHLCGPSSCGKIQNISYPFRLKNDLKLCGYYGYELVCENNTTFLFDDDSHKYRVQAINYHKNTIRLAYADINENDTCSFPLYFPRFHFGYPYYFHGTGSSVTLLSCQYPINNPNFLGKAYHCATKRDDASNASSSSNRSNNTYIWFGHLKASSFPYGCNIDRLWPVSSSYNHDNLSISELHRFLLYGFELSFFGYTEFWIMPITIEQIIFWVVPIIGINLAAKIIFGVPIVLGLIIYKYRTRHLSMFDGIEGFLQNHKNLVPIRYSYSDIKKMTRGFREKLGQGGYGSVYKGKLRSGHDVAVKLLTKPKEHGKEFMNEISTIGRIHHVNVVKLVGYCAERSKRALVYDFMPNGSLEKYIQSEETTNSLTWSRKYDIAVGVARGIQYLHRGCDIQILHFDIKPHNILLDENFIPKVSDFGLAKSYSTDHNTVTLTAARGTIGYVAPELINRNIGGVSYKADVYSFGMMLIGMVGLNRDLLANAENSSQYFPHWIYSHLDKTKDIEMGNANEIEARGDDDDAKITRKMALVALWCILMYPDDRPSMSRVLEMLETEVELLQIPPEPSFPGPHQFVQTEETYTATDSIALLCDDTNSSDK